jgi:SAM-dependent methyltransferase
MTKNFAIAPSLIASLAIHLAALACAAALVGQRRGDARHEPVIVSLLIPAAQTAAADPRNAIPRRERERPAPHLKNEPARVAPPAPANANSAPKLIDEMKSTPPIGNAPNHTGRTSPQNLRIFIVSGCKDKQEGGIDMATESSFPRARDHHDWDSADYVSHWASGQDPKEKDREDAFRLLADTIPFDKKLPIRILDLGAGYGALTQFLLNRFPNATAVCQDGSKEMANLGAERMKKLAGRFEYVLCDFAKKGWQHKLKGPFEAVVSSIAIHNVREPKIIEAIYHDVFPLVKAGGCFLNFDRPRPPWDEQMKWLRDAGFKNVQISWQEENRAVFGGFRDS